MSDKPLVIAVDGPAASGKGTLARRLAADLGAEYLDTGKLYRYVGYKLLESEYDIDDAKDEDSLAAQHAVAIAHKVDIKHIDELELGTEEVGRAASIVSAIAEVRQALLAFQRDVSNSPNGAVLDGRDIGTVVCPNAHFKFFITADVATRAQRRYKELQNKGNSVIYDSVLHDLSQRDARDSRRAISPMSVAEDAIHIDTTSLNMDEVYAKVMEAIGR